MAKAKPRAKTVEECREEVVRHVRVMANYWAEIPDKTPKERCEGVAFSILVALDGGSMAVPAYDVRVAPHPSDKEYQSSQGENWYEPGMLINDCQLHEMFFEKKST
jgi:hypothetical protein